RQLSCEEGSRMTLSTAERTLQELQNVGYVMETMEVWSPLIETQHDDKWRHFEATDVVQLTIRMRKSEIAMEESEVG
ncbi:MAG: hypothetical protein QGD91_12290, partial [Actinomycetota bacterium]|nr:hypothetical protein [Actinomycetota bacterium]